MLLHWSTSVTAVVMQSKKTHSHKKKYLYIFFYYSQFKEIT